MSGFKIITCLAFSRLILSNTLFCQAAPGGVRSGARARARPGRSRAETGSEPLTQRFVQIEQTSGWLALRPDAEVCPNRTNLQAAGSEALDTTDRVLQPWFNSGHLKISQCSTKL